MERKKLKKMWIKVKEKQLWIFGLSIPLVSMHYLLIQFVSVILIDIIIIRSILSTGSISHTSNEKYKYKWFNLPANVIFVSINKCS